MKKIGTYTCRGQVTADSTAPTKIILDDGSFKTAYRLTKFVVAASDMDNTNQRMFSAKIATTPTLPQNINWNWQDQREIAWANFAYDANGIFPLYFNQVDSDNLIVQDIYLFADEPGGSTTNEMNYWIEFEKYEISDWQGALAMARDKSSGGD